MTLLDLLSSINKRITDMMIPNRSSKNPLLSPSAEFGQPSTTFESRFTSQLRTSKGGVRNEPELASSNTSYEAARDIEYQDEDRTDETATEQTLQRNPISFVAKVSIIFLRF